jgi:arylformamidase
MVHWPDNPPVRIHRILDMDQGHEVNVLALSMGAHTGTHMDAPLHFVPAGDDMEAMPLSATMGPARVLAIADPVAITPDELARQAIQAGERLLFKTRNSPAAWQASAFVEDFVYLSAAGARYLVERQVRTVGVDYLSVGSFRRSSESAETHRTLLEAGIWIIEGLDLTAVRPGSVELICLPLRLVGADGAPARAIVRPLQTP